jgi:LDH2 family malate/lactate/ureidoglycolate dehydrogenase
MSDLAQRLTALTGRDTASAAELEAIAAEMLANCGVAKIDAKNVASALVDAQLRGSQSHGLMHLPAYVRGLIEGTINPAPQIAAKAGTGGAAVIDADNGLGVLAGLFAIDHLAPLARRFGIAAAAVRNSNHFGVGGYFAERAAAQGLICLAFSNASPTMAPFGGREAVLGTNPIAAGFPLPGADPVVLDMSTSGVARARIRQAAREGIPIPADWSLDAAGRPTADPAAALKGTIQPLAGAKGYGLALMAELLSSTLSDGTPGYDVASPHESAGRPAGVSHFFIIIDPRGFCGAERQGRRAAAVVERIERSEPVDPAHRPRLPGARGHAARRRAMKDGIALTPALRNALAEAARLLDRPPALRLPAATGASA